MAHLWDITVATSWQGKTDPPKFPRPADAIESRKKTTARHDALVKKYLDRQKRTGGTAP